jgi:DNA-binding MarR family transcriptional regulator
MPGSSVSYIRMRLLRALECDGDQTMTELAIALDVTQRRVTALVDALEGDGFVERRPHPTDGRSTVVALTNTGQAQQNVNCRR